MTTGIETLKTRDLKPRIGTEVLADKAALLSGQHADALRELLEQRGVLVFPRIGLSDDEQIAFTQTLGTFAPERSGEKLYSVTLDTTVNAQADYLKGSLYWHIDGTMNDVPIRASLLTSKVLPSDGGGDTEFCNTYAAYDGLSDEDKAELHGLTAMHSAWNTLFYFDPEPDLAHLRSMMRIGDKELPLVWRHPSGRKSLVLGCTARHIVGTDYVKSAELLVRLREWSTRPDFVYRHQWSVGDLVIWDNTGTMHRAMPYNPDSGRLLVRTKLEGEEPFA
ncbi:MAG TPA: TauD/TfdA family dioxygenase [Mycobacterium sp.]